MLLGKLNTNENEKKQKSKNILKMEGKLLMTSWRAITKKLKKFWPNTHPITRSLL